MPAQGLELWLRGDYGVTADTGGKVTSWAVEGSPLKVHHYSEEISLSLDEAVTRPILPVKAGPRPSQPPGRAPIPREARTRSTKPLT